MRENSDVKPYACEAWGRKFLQKNYLKGHMSVHSGDKSFDCEACGNSFTTNANLTEHDCNNAGAQASGSS